MIEMTAKKMERMTNVSNAKGVIAAAAMDQRGSLKKGIAKAKGCQPGDVTDGMMEEFKVAVTKVLTHHSSAILLDPQWGLPATKVRQPSAGLLLAYESSGYDQTQPGRIPELLDNWNVGKSVEHGADCIKILMYYTPDEKKDINAFKHDWIRKIGEECHSHQMPFFLECITYDETGGDEKGYAYAKRKPAAVGGYMKEFSKPEYHVDVLKVEVPINMAYVEGAIANKTGEVAYTRAEAMQHFLRTAEGTSLPFIYLSAGVDDDVFRESLVLAGESGAKFNGVLCGRATWKEGIPIYAKQGVQALEDWLNDRGVKNIKALNDVLDRVATPWWDVYGGKDQIKIAG